MEKMLPLEQEFVDAQTNALKEISEHIKEAKEALNKAVEVSEKYGIPFRSGISYVRNTYTPETFHTKFKDLDEDFLYETAETYFDHEAGWTHSAVC